MSEVVVEAKGLQRVYSVRRGLFRAPAHLQAVGNISFKLEKGRTLAVDMLNRSLLSDFLPAQSARGLGLYLIGRIGPLRRAVLREGVAPAASQPRLMRGEVL